ncbi:ParB/RepB/Spo0J family partition protein [Sphingomonas sp. BGYR3]|uniref:ParB/RepB/Spo0J family partition protein n=1 Tax=Sphingomonas sp. BGYR3 TaxID=2975483 RepID=UPI0021A799AD|nr:ParB/RepB/Spo0J family partition protein [Sphingomonas sp. BGYR3]MDG5488857.1 ParB/RepB/Spo0J family partition protein [Sphingomonas sp. BGYR3]
MKLDFIPLDKLAVSKANMRYARKAPDVADILPTIRARGVLVPLMVRPQPCSECAGGNAPGLFEIVAGSRRYHAARIVADETGQPEPLPCAILDAGDDAAAIEASLIENLARLDPDEVTQWETFTRLVRQGRRPEEIAATFGLPDLTVRRVLALGNLLPRIRHMYAREAIDAATVRHLTLASKSQQRDWLALADDPEAYLPTGHQLKAWLFGGQSIPVRHALFDVEASGLAIVSDLFGEERWFADADAFWAAQQAAVEARRTAYLDAGWADVVIVPISDQFHSWDYEKTAKRKGGRIYIELRTSGEAVFHEGYLSRKEARRAAGSEGGGAVPAKASRPELSGPMQDYLDLHRHAAARAALLGAPSVALRLLVAHAIAASPYWNVRAEPQSARHEATSESVETSRGETLFDERRRAVLALLGCSPDEPTVIGSMIEAAGGDPVVALFWRLLDLPDTAIMDVIAVIMGESLASGSAAVEAVGLTLGLDMADWWQADPAFLELVRDREVLTALVADVAGEPVATANAREKGKTLKRIVTDHLEGNDGRSKVERWVPRWMAFPPAAYTERGGVGTLNAHAMAEAARVPVAPPKPPAAPVALAAPEPDPACDPANGEPVQLAA